MADPARLGALLLVLSVAGTATAQDRPSLEPIWQGEATAVLGKPVRGPNGEAMGRVVDVLVDDKGQPRAAVIDFGGFLGVGSRKIAVTWQVLQFHPPNRDAPVTLVMTREQVQAAPEYKTTSQPAQAVAPPPSSDARQ
jgi:hypothetical protein